MFEVVALFLSIVFFSGYTLLIYYFKKGWTQIPQYTIQKKPSVKLSCVIALRNEEKCLARLINGLQSQSYPEEDFEVILVNDNSTDNSVSILKSLLADLPNFHLIENKGEGKKKAILTGISHSKFEVIVTSDADCIHNKNWLLQIGSYFQLNEPDLLVAPVMMIKQKGYLNLFQRIDFFSLILSGAGAIGINKPIMCNAANLAFTKHLYYKAEQFINNEYASGDDIFLLHFANANGYKIDYLKSKQAIVYTLPVNSLMAFVNQRVRWASKSKGYEDNFTLQVAWIVFLSNFLICLLPVGVFYFPVLGWSIAVFFVIKNIIDFRFLSKGAHFYNIKMPLKDFLKVQSIYPFYIFFTVIYALFGSFKWKDRKGNSCINM